VQKYDDGKIRNKGLVLFGIILLVGLVGWGKVLCTHTRAHTRFRGLANIWTDNEKGSAR